MRNLSLIVAAAVGVSLAVPAEAQRVWRGGQWVQQSGRGASLPPRATPPARINPPQQQGGRMQGAPRPGGWNPGAQRPGSRWGQKVGGRWQGGMRAPGGWGAYRRPVRGWTMPSYWIGGSFFLSDWSNWGLSRPPYGYNWVRYYDDAVLVDRGGRVWDSVSGLDWDRGDAYAYAGDGYAYAEAQGGAGGGGYSGGYGAQYQAPEDDYDDRYEDRPIPSQPYPGGYAPPAPVYRAPAAQSPCGQGCGYQQRGFVGGGYAASGGYYYTAPVTTTIVIQSAPVVTTTTVTEEVIEESSSYVTQRAVRRAPSKRLWRTPTKAKCYC
ncbi:RcnB family protein [Sphingomonas sp. LT1P40]|uniref:RcnB family protein n=1 Tax=Alteristakelama amylovorans TaxID=3096166 RepID=UPI002FCC652F